jgi:hypothetical protein
MYFLKESLRAEAMCNIEARGRKIYHCKYTMLFWQGPVQKVRIIEKVYRRQIRKRGNEMSKTRVLIKLWKNVNRRNVI